MFVVVLEQGGNERQNHREPEQVHKQEQEHVTQCGVRTGASVGGRAPGGRSGASPEISSILLASNATTEFGRRLFTHRFFPVLAVLMYRVIRMLGWGCLVESGRGL